MWTHILFPELGSAMSAPDREADENSHDRVIARSGIFRRNALAIENHTVAVVQVEQSSKPIYLKSKNSKEFYVRAGNTSKLLDVEASHNYISMHWEM